MKFPIHDNLRIEPTAWLDTKAEELIKSTRENKTWKRGKGA